MTGDDSHEHDEFTPWCPDCHGELAQDVTVDTVNTDGVSGYVPIEELEALADAWEDCPGAHPTQGAGMSKAKEQCAQELREVIEQYE